MHAEGAVLQLPRAQNIAQIHFWTSARQQAFSGAGVVGIAFSEALLERRNEIGALGSGRISFAELEPPNGRTTSVHRNSNRWASGYCEITRSEMYRAHTLGHEQIPRIRNVISPFFRCQPAGGAA